MLSLRRKLSAHTEVTQDKETFAVRVARHLTRSDQIVAPFLAAHAERSGAEELRALLTPTQTAGPVDATSTIIN